MIRTTEQVKELIKESYGNRTVIATPEENTDTRDVIRILNEIYPGNSFISWEDNGTDFVIPSTTVLPIEIGCAMDDYHYAVYSDTYEDLTLYDSGVMTIFVASATKDVVVLEITVY